MPRFWTSHNLLFNALKVLDINVKILKIQRVVIEKKEEERKRILRFLAFMAKSTVILSICIKIPLLYGLFKYFFSTNSANFEKMMPRFWTSHILLFNTLKALDIDVKILKIQRAVFEKKEEERKQFLRFLVFFGKCTVILSICIKIPLLYVLF